MTTYRIIEQQTRFAGARYDVQVIIGGRHAHWQEFATRDQAQAWVAAQNPTEGASMSAQERLVVAREALRVAQERLARAERGRYGDNLEWRAALDAVSVATVAHARLRREARHEERGS